MPLVTGHKVTGVRYVLEEGASHEVDSSEWAFYQAAQYSFEQVSEEGQWQVLEPIMLIEVNVPEEFQGAVNGMLSRRNGLILNTEGADGWVTVEVEAPLNDMFGFSNELRSATQVMAM